MKLKQLIFGLATYVPGVNQIRMSAGGTDSARYCYSIWLRHLVMTKNNGLDSNPKTVAELGPGESLGTGLAALISGCDQYFAFDIVEHANTERNVKIFEELLTLFKSRTPIPGEDEFPKAKPYLETYDFPVDILDDSRMDRALNQSRIDRIRNSIGNFRNRDSLIQYRAPWYDANIVETGTVDMIFSQAVLAQVDDLRNTYKAMHSWLKPKGVISHTIDFKCHGTAKEWNGHWAYSDLIWRLIRGKRPYLLNREPHSNHIATMIEGGFKLVCDKKISLESRLAKSDLAPRFHFISDDDLVTSSAFIQGIKEIECEA